MYKFSVPAETLGEKCVYSIANILNSETAEMLLKYNTRIEQLFADLNYAVIVENFGIMMCN